MVKTDRTAFSLIGAGLVLFFIGLLLGFPVAAFPGSKPLLSAHQAALGSGMFLMGLGLVWRAYMKTPSSWLATSVWLSHYLMAAGIGLGGLELPGLNVKPAAGLMTLAACVVMVVMTFLVLIKFLRAGGRARELQAET
ncbi:MAG: hypothetical protein ACXU8U_01320 [Asticcacaulis sp.]